MLIIKMVNSRYLVEIVLMWITIHSSFKLTRIHIRNHPMIDSSIKCITAVDDYQTQSSIQQFLEPDNSNADPSDDPHHANTIASDERQRQLTRYLRRIKRRHEMPLSQSWYKFKQKHISKNQKRVYASLWPLYGIDLAFNTTLNLQEQFGLNVSATTGNPYVVLEIGFGSGESLVRVAAENPTKYYLGCEIHRASIANTLTLINQTGLTNIRLVRSDVTVLFESHLQRDCIDEVSIFFPDPWLNSGRDCERRVVRRYLLGLYALALKNRGKLNIATDVEDYANHVRTTVEDCNHRIGSCSSDPTSSYAWEAVRIYDHVPAVELPVYRSATRYERKAAAEGRGVVWDFQYELLK